MSKTLYDEAIAEAKLLRETAEQNAKNAIIEAVTPRIRNFIEEQLLGDTPMGDDSDLLQEVASNIVGSSTSEDVVLDESALISLLEMFSGENLSSVRGHKRVKTALGESFSSLKTSDKAKILRLADKLNQNSEFFDGSGINNDVRVQQENSTMARSEDILYEVDLDELANMTASMMSEKDEEDLEEADVEELEEREQEELKEIMKSLGLNSLLNEDKIEIDLGEVELDPEIQLVARLVADDDDDEEVDVDIDVDEEGEEGEEEVDMDEEFPMDGPEELEEVFEIDERVLRSELSRLRSRISEAKDLVKIKGIKNDMAHSWGGKGDSKAGTKGAYGGTGKGGGDAWGGGKRSGDPLKVTLNKLSEAVKHERRKNRSLTSKLNEYRSAVETLREQLTDLNLFNAKLLYVNKLLQNKDIGSSQRRTVVESIDNAKSLREVRLVYKTLTESFNRGKGGVLRESVTRKALGSSSRLTGRGSSQSASAEVNRWSVLAGIKE